MALDINIPEGFDADEPFYKLRDFEGTLTIDTELLDEHVNIFKDSESHGVDGDPKPESTDTSDSREKLAADICAEITAYAGGFGEEEELFHTRILAMLDRQSAITRLECAESRKSRLTELHNQLDESTREREWMAKFIEFTCKSFEELERAYNELKREFEATNEAREDIEDLRADRDNWNKTAWDYYHMWKQSSTECKNLRKKVKDQTSQLSQVQSALEKRNNGELKRQWVAERAKLLERIAELEKHAVEHGEI